MSTQEAIAVAIVILAAIYLVRKLTGWPKPTKAPDEGAPVLSSRLQRGLRAAQSREKKPPRSGCH